MKFSGRGKRSNERRGLFRAISAARARCRFKILVWGPDPKSASPAAAKRAEIRGELEKVGHDVYYSEDLGVPGTPLNVQELFQTNRINLAINVAASPGPAAEFEEYGLALGRKLLLWLPEAARGGYTAGGMLRLFRSAGGIHEFFDDSDLRSCVVTLASIDWMRDKEALQIWADGQKEIASRVAPLG